MACLHTPHLRIHPGRPCRGKYFPGPTDRTRLAALFLATHSSSKLHGQIPSHLPEGCRAATPELERKGFLANLSDDRYRLDSAMRHLAGMLRSPADLEEAKHPVQRPAPPTLSRAARSLGLSP
ncbi:hypothetical protein [Streptomyces sp. NPDC048473]|uniref:hypothetical protein n=1 Tax=unclassified Streptomyces TaxID=2593676 RepID=UPI003723DB47